GSSDVCSSDLAVEDGGQARGLQGRAAAPSLSRVNAFRNGGGRPGHQEPYGGVGGQARLGGGEGGGGAAVEEAAQDGGVAPVRSRLAARLRLAVRLDQPGPDGLRPVVVELAGVQDEAVADALGGGDLPGAGPDGALGDVDGAEHRLDGHALPGPGDAELGDE